MMKSAVCGLAVALAFPVAADAGDYADRTILGFSPDGAYFAFEEYGVQDGSGFPYSNIYVIDTAADRWVDGTPVRVLIEGDEPSLSETRSEALDMARPVLMRYQVHSTGEQVVINPVTETSADPHFVSFQPLLAVPPVDRDFEVRVEEYQLPAPDCPDLGQPFQGFRLTLTEPDGTSHVLNEDSRVPSSRRCPLSYGISDVVTFPQPSSETPTIVVLLNVFSVGFEGPDRRFLAVTYRP